MIFGARLWIVSGAVVLALAVAALAIFGPWDGARPIDGPTVGEKLAALRTERASLQARAAGEARIRLLPAFRIAGLLGDALAARGEPDRERAFAQLVPMRRDAFAELDDLNVALRDALARPEAGMTAAVRVAAERAAAALERLAGADAMPLVLQYTPRFVSPRRAAAELPLQPSTSAAAPSAGAVRLAPGGDRAETAFGHTVPRYVPPFATVREDDPPIEVEIVGLHLAPGATQLPVLAIGKWRGEAEVAPERLRFSVPRHAFASDATRANFATGSLFVRGGAQLASFELLFVVLPDRPGSFALDQKVTEAVTESKVLVSPEILARGGAGEARTVRRCFDPPEGWAFDKERRRLLVVERLGWADDIPDTTLNSGTAEFAADEPAHQICVVVTAKPVTKTARAATIGRFEVTLVRERDEVRPVRSGIRGLDWREAVRVPIEGQAQEWKLYLQLFDEIEREFSGTVPSALPFLRIAIEGQGDARTMVLTADPLAEP
ncbi:MAG: hypothetical protein KIT25_07170 [Enhydrobacter sp.]|nr:MAG: hypothetical protein KIT25_07170 [Enhydrobacter sp.]